MIIGSFVAHMVLLAQFTSAGPSSNEPAFLFGYYGAIVVLIGIGILLDFFSIRVLKKSKEKNKKGSA